MDGLSASSEETGGGKRGVIPGLGKGAVGWAALGVRSHHPNATLGSPTGRSACACLCPCPSQNLFALPERTRAGRGADPVFLSTRGTARPPSGPRLWGSRAEGSPEEGGLGSTCSLLCCATSLTLCLPALPATPVTLAAAPASHLLLGPGLGLRAPNHPF